MSEHVTSRKTYFAIFFALLILTYVTIAVSRIDLGRMNTVVALAIAVTKAVLVVLFFMHIRYSTKLTKLVVVGGFLWLALLIGFTMTDMVSRDWIRVGQAIRLPGRNQSGAIVIAVTRSSTDRPE